MVFCLFSFLNKETETYELELDGPNYNDVMLYLEEDEVTTVMKMIQNGDYTHYTSRISEQRYKNLIEK